VDENEREKDAPDAPEPAAAPEAPEPEAARPSALAAWQPGPPVSEPDGVGEVPAIEGMEPPASEPPAEAEEASVLPPPEIRAALEALVFASPQPITPREISRVLQGVPREDWEREMEALRADYARDDRGLQVIEVAGGYQITTRPEYNDWVRELLDPRTPTRLSIQALETLAVIAYKQPVTLPEIIDLRGVKSGGVVKTLLEKRLIRITGRKEVVGRPMLYGTTKQFLLHFGLKSLDELPKIEEFAEVLGEEVDVAGLKRAIESPLPVQVTLSDPGGEQMPLFGEAAAPPGEAAEAPADGAPGGVAFGEHDGGGDAVPAADEGAGPELEAEAAEPSAEADPSAGEADGSGEEDSDSGDTGGPGGGHDRRA
jgi:segregation and condensation protein B